jgi:hypothetical protein
MQAKSVALLRITFAVNRYGVRNCERGWRDAIAMLQDIRRLAAVSDPIESHPTIHPSQLSYVDKEKRDKDPSLRSS